MTEGDPGAWRHSPWSGLVEDGHLHGRGSADMKGGLAAAMVAAAAVRRAGIPLAGRLMVAAQMLEEGDRAADAVARHLDFPSGSAFRNTCQRYVGATPHEMKAKGGAAWVVSRFKDSLKR